MIKKLCFLFSCVICSIALFSSGSAPRTPVFMHDEQANFPVPPQSSVLTVNVGGLNPKEHGSRKAFDLVMRQIDKLPKDSLASQCCAALPGVNTVRYEFDSSASRQYQVMSNHDDSLIVLGIVQDIYAERVCELEDRISRGIVDGDFDLNAPCCYCDVSKRLCLVTDDETFLEHYHCNEKIINNIAARVSSMLRYYNGE